MTAEDGTTPQDPDGWMWDLTIPGNNDHDFYIDIDIAATAVLVHNCPSSRATMRQVMALSS